MLVLVRGRVAKFVEAGKTEAQVVQSRSSEDYDDTWGKDFSKPKRFIQSVYANVLLDRERAEKAKQNSKRRSKHRK